MLAPGFPRTAAVVAAVAALGLSVPPGHVGGRPAGAGSGLQPVVREVYLMGTRATLVTFDASRVQALKRLDQLLAALEQTEQELSTWRPESVMSRLNRQPPGVPFTLPHATCAAMQEVFRWHEATGGVFDPTVGRLLEAWKVGDGGRLPDAREIEAARHNTGLQYLQLNPQSCQIARSRDVQIDTGGFGKGDALDRAAAAADGGHPWLIDLGGQVMVDGSPPESQGWEVFIAHPQRRDEPLFALRLADGSLSTSSGSERDVVVRGVRVGHILDPRTGRPAPFSGSVTVWHQTGLAADILSTALYVMGPEQGLAWADAHDVAACYLYASLRESGIVEIRTSRAFDRRFPGLRRTAYFLTSPQVSIAEPW